MCKVKEIISMIFLFAAIPVLSNADPVVWNGNGTYEIGDGKDWFQISELQTYDNVIVKMYEGGGVGSFSMYDNSNLTMYVGAEINNSLYLYNNATVTVFGSHIGPEIYIDPAATGWVKFYAYNVSFVPDNPYGEGHIYGNWLYTPVFEAFDIVLKGHGAYSHIQVVPEPATLILLGLGSLAILRQRK